MLQPEDILIAGPVALRDSPERDTERWLGRDAGEVSRPLSRDIPRETNERPTPPAPDGHVATEKGDAPRKGRPRRLLALSLGALTGVVSWLHRCVLGADADLTRGRAAGADTAQSEAGWACAFGPLNRGRDLRRSDVVGVPSKREC